MSMDVEMPVVDDAGEPEPVEVGSGFEAFREALDLAGDDPDFVAALDALDVITVTPAEDGGFTFSCGSASVTVSADQVMERLGMEPSEEPAE